MFFCVILNHTHKPWLPLCLPFPDISMQLLLTFSFICKLGQRVSVLIVIRRRNLVLRSKLCIMNQVRARCSGTALFAKQCAQMCQWIKWNLYTFILKANVIHFNFLLCVFKYQSWMSAFKLRTCDSTNVFFTMTCWLYHVSFVSHYPGFACIYIIYVKKPFKCVRT